MKKQITVIGAVLLFHTVAWGLPQGESVVSGQAEFQNINDTTLNVIAEDKTIIEYDAFNIGAGETVRFIQPSVSATVLNRVTGVSPSEISGSLQSNGQVFLINPNGIFFGPSSQVDTGSFLASTLNIENEDFLAGRYLFSQQEGALSSFIINQGDIVADPNGFIVLAAPLVSNTGIIRAQSGQVVINGTSSTTISFDSQNLISYVLDSDVVLEEHAAIPYQYVSETLEELINFSNVVLASEIVVEDDVMKLVSSEGIVHNAGEIKVDSVDDSDAGDILIDSNKMTVISKDAVVSSNGGGVSDGGDVFILSDLRTGYSLVEGGAQLESKGGSISGDGGFIEVSAEHIWFHGVADTSATQGQTGIFLLDPLNIDIKSGLLGPILNTLDGLIGGGLLFAETAILDDIYEDTLEGQTANTILQARGTITIENLSDNVLDFTNLDTESLTLQAGENITFADENDMIRTAGGAIHLEADSPHSTSNAADGSGTLTIGKLDSSGGNITLIGANFDIDAAVSDIDAGGGNILIAPSQNGTALALGSATGTVLTNDELNRISNYGTLTIGQATTKGTDGAGTGATTLIAGAITLDEISLGTNNLTLISSSTINDDDNTGDSIVTSGTLTLTAATGIGTAGTLQTAVTTISATTTNGNIDIDNNNASSTTLSSLTTGTGDLSFSQSGGGVLSVTTATTTDGDIAVDVTSANLTASSVTAGGNGQNVNLSTLTSGNILLGALTADSDQITVNSAGAITDNNGGTTNLTASTLDLDAVSGIGSSDALETAVSSIAADTTNGKIDIDNNNASAVTVSSLTTGAGNLDFGQTGGGSLNITTATTSNGQIDITVAAANLTATTVTAGGSNNVNLSTTSSGNVLLGAITADSDQITISSAGNITDNNAGTTNLTASTLDLNSVSGIGSGDSVETEASTIAADTTNGNISLTNNNASSTTLSSLTTGTGDLVFNQSGGGALSVTTATTSDGQIDLSVTAANLTAATVTAGGSNNLNLSTTTSGNILLGAITAASDQITINSAGAITDNNAGTTNLTASTLDLDAASGIGSSDALETAATSITADSTNGNVDLDNNNTSITTLSSFTSGTGDLLFSQSGAGALNLVSATTSNGNITVDVTSANLTASSVTAGGNGQNVNLSTLTSGDLLISTITASSDQITLNSAGNIQDQNGSSLNLTSSNVDLTTVGDLGSLSDPFDIQAETIDTSSVSGNSFINEFTNNQYNFKSDSPIGVINSPLTIPDDIDNIILNITGERNGISGNFIGNLVPSQFIFSNIPPGLVLLNNSVIGGGQSFQLQTARGSEQQAVSGVGISIPEVSLVGIGEMILAFNPQVNPDFVLVMVSELYKADKSDIPGFTVFADSSQTDPQEFSYPKERGEGQTLLSSWGDEQEEGWDMYLNLAGSGNGFLLGNDIEALVSDIYQEYQNLLLQLPQTGQVRAQQNMLSAGKVGLKIENSDFISDENFDVDFSDILPQQVAAVAEDTGIAFGTETFADITKGRISVSYNSKKTGKTKTAVDLSQVGKGITGGSLLQGKRAGLDVWDGQDGNMPMVLSVSNDSIEGGTFVGVGLGKMGLDGEDEGGDTGIDIGLDLGMDLGMDEGVDVGLDVGIDEGLDNDDGVDIGIDIGADVGLDNGADIGIDVGIDDGPPENVIEDDLISVALPACGITVSVKHSEKPQKDESSVEASKEGVLVKSSSTAEVDLEGPDGERLNVLIQNAQHTPDEMNENILNNKISCNGIDLKADTEQAVLMHFRKEIGVIPQEGTTSVYESTEIQKDNSVIINDAGQIEFEISGAKHIVSSDKKWREIGFDVVVSQYSHLLNTPSIQGKNLNDYITFIGEKRKYNNE